MPGTPQPKILVIEDDPDVAEMLNAYFHVQGFEVFTVNWGEDGVRACQSDRPDIVILDIRLPDIDGYEVARRLRADRRTQAIPIIFLTEKTEHADRLQGLELGAEDYLTKPFDVQELRLRIRNVLDRVEQASLTNPVSGLPEGVLVDERLGEAMQNGGASAAMVGLEHLEDFREAYGFVASDDVLRAASLIITKTLREIGATDEFLGHIGPASFLVVLPSGQLAALMDRLRARLEGSFDVFYPIGDRQQAAQRENRLGVTTSSLALAGGHFTGPEQVKAELLRLKK